MKNNSYLTKGNIAFREKRYRDSLYFYNELLKISGSSSPVSKLALVNIELVKNRLSKDNYKNLGFDNFESAFVLQDKVLELSKSNSSYISENTHKTVDIIIPVYNALEDVKKCLYSVYSYTDGYNVTVYVINDGSNEQTSMWLQNFCLNKDNFALIVNNTNIGYTKTVNRGLKASTGEFVVTLNSDTIVTPGWLSSMIGCAEKKENIGIVGPLSNAASWQNVPLLKDEVGEFAINEIPIGSTPLDMAAIVQHTTKRHYPKIPFINGFCFLIKRKVIDVIGYLDEINFPEGYGEENDFCVRANDSGFELAIADDAYVFHAKSKSFGSEKKKLLSQKGSLAIREKHTSEHFDSYLKLLKDTSVLDTVRKTISNVLNVSSLDKAIVNSLDLSILFLLPVSGKGGGGTHSVVQEVSAMKAIGVKAEIAVMSKSLPAFLNSYQSLPSVNEIFKPYSNIIELENIISEYDVVIATVYSSVQTLKEIYLKEPHFIPAYYIQDYEPYFFEENSENYNIAFESYNLIDNCVNFAKTSWICNEVFKKNQVLVNKVEASVDHSVYYPKQVNRSKKLTICAMIRPASPRRSPLQTLNVLRVLKKNLGSNLDIYIFGCSPNDKFFDEFPCEFISNNFGELHREEVAKVLASSDVFLDMSEYQAFGRTAIEAMACGCVPVITLYGGADEFAISGFNSLLIDSTDQVATSRAILGLLDSPNLLNSLKTNALITAANYSIHKAAISELTLFARKATERGYLPKVYSQEKIIIYPSLSKTQNDEYIPTGSAYVRLIYPYWKNKLKGYSYSLQNKYSLPSPGSANYFLCQRELIGIDINLYKEWAGKWKEKGGKIIYDIDDNLTDTVGLLKRTNKSELEVNEIKERIIILARIADVVTVSTQRLFEILEPYNKNIKIIPNLLDEELWRLNESTEFSVNKTKKINDGIIRIGYIGTPTHEQDLDIVVEAIKKIEQKYKEKVIVEVVGGYEKIPPKFGRRVALPKNKNYINFVDWLGKRINWDIGIIPLEIDEFNKSKSYLKFIEYAALDLAIVCSNTLTYKDVAQHKYNCLVSDNTTESWYKNIEQLIIDNDLRMNIKINAYKELIEKHTIQRNKELFRGVMQAVI